MGLNFTFLLVISYSFVISAQENFNIIVDERTVEKLAIKRGTQKPGLASIGKH